MKTCDGDRTRRKSSAAGLSFRVARAKMLVSNTTRIRQDDGEHVPIASSTVLSNASAVMLCFSGAHRRDPCLIETRPRLCMCGIVRLDTGVNTIIKTCDHGPLLMQQRFQRTLLIAGNAPISRRVIDSISLLYLKTAPTRYHFLMLLFRACDEIECTGKRFRRGAISRGFRS